MAEYIKREDVLEILHKVKYECVFNRQNVMYDGKVDAYKALVARFKATPAADVVEVVRCKDCKHWFDNGTDYGSCYQDALVRHRGFFCLLGERRADDV